MATIIVRTNPDKRADGRWTCSQCHSVYQKQWEAKACADADYEKRTGRKPVPMEV